MIRVWLETLGCKANQYDTERLRGVLAALGCLPAASLAEAGLVLVNTCAVTAAAERKSRQALRRAARQGARVVALGCLAAAKRAGALPPGVEAFPAGARAEGQAELLAALGLPGSGHSPCPPSSRRTRAFVKVQDGCDRRCTYCAIPALRGPSRSRPAAEVAAEVAGLAARGTPEIVLTGVCLGDWREGAGRLEMLVGRLAALSGSFRLRLSSLEPEQATPALLEAMAQAGPERVCPHLHLALQSGSDRVLRRMGRRYGASGFLGIVAAARRRLAGPTFTTDVIAGFPGEEEADLEATLAVLAELKPARVHVFPYSCRPDTPAARLPGHVSPARRRRRAARIRALAEELAREAARNRVGLVEDLVLERAGQGVTGGYQRACLRAGAGRRGERLPFLVEGHRGSLLLGVRA